MSQAHQASRGWIISLKMSVLTVYYFCYPSQFNVIVVYGQRLTQEIS